jgi:hypothetical protein
MPAVPHLLLKANTQTLCYSKRNDIGRDEGSNKLFQKVV